MSHRQPATSGTSCERCSAQYTPYLRIEMGFSFCIFVNTLCTWTIRQTGANKTVSVTYAETRILPVVSLVFGYRPMTIPTVVNLK